MSESSMVGLEFVLAEYFRAKDGNRPHLLDSVFADDATLEVHNSSASIAFPALTNGRAAIADVLVRRFTQTYENVYSFYMARPPESASTFCCDWLVCMSEKATRNAIVGCGRYDWAFQTASPQLVSSLVITIREMHVLPPPLWGPIASWVRRLNYPWSTGASACTSAPRIELLSPVLQYLGRGDTAH